MNKRIAILLGCLFALFVLGTSDTMPVSWPRASAEVIGQQQLAPNVPTFDCTSVTEIPQSECEALVAFYNSTGGPQWVFPRGVTSGHWLATNTPCNWYGAACTAGHVTSIQLNFNNLTGSLPPEIGQLPFLRILLLQRNPIGGTIPPEIGQLSNLVALWFNYNQMTGGIPPEIGQLANLYDLQINYTQLDGTIPAELGNLDKLYMLDLSDNRLTGSIPPELGNIRDLNFLILSNNRLTGSIPPQLSNLANLQSLELAWNQLTDSIPPELGNLNLYHLHLSRNLLAGGIPPELGNLTSLTTLDLSSNQLGGEVPVEITQLTQVGGHFLDYNKFTASDPQVIAFLNSKDPDWAQTQTVPPTNVQADVQPDGVHLTWTPILFTNPNYGGYYEILRSSALGGPYTLHAQTQDKTVSGYVVSDLPVGTHYFVIRAYTPHSGYQQNALWSDYSAEVVAVVGAPLPTATPTLTPTPTITPTPAAFDCAGVTEIPQSECEALVAFYNSTSGPQWMYDHGWLMTNTPCSWLGILCSEGHVSSIQIDNFIGMSGSLPPELGQLSRLRVLVLERNPIGGTIPPELGQLSNLVALWLNLNQMTGGIPPEFGQLANLYDLQIRFTQLDGTIPSELGNLDKLYMLNLGYNRLTGGIPPELGNIRDLNFLILGNNQLTGSIPPELSNLANLQSLDLTNNQLTGPIPPEIGNLRLHGLRFSRNLLAGPIPPELGNLTSLTTLDVSNNQLGGEIPVEITQLAQLNSLSLDYNKFTASDPQVTTFLNTKDPDWAQTQTVPPSDVQVDVQPDGVHLTWTPILYTRHGGYYEILYSSAPGGPYTLYAQTQDKTVSGYVVSDLPAGTHYFVIRAYTPPHSGYQQNALWSEYSQEVMAEVLGSTTPTATATPTYTPSPTATSPTVADTDTPTATATASPTSTATPIETAADIAGLVADTERARGYGWISDAQVYQRLLDKLHAAQTASEQGLLFRARRHLDDFLYILDAWKGQAVSQQAYDLLKPGALSVYATLANQPPQTGAFTAQPPVGTLGEPVLFTVTSQDPNGWKNIAVAYLLVNTSLTSQDGLLLRLLLVEEPYVLFLRSDPAGWEGECTVGSNTVLSTPYGQVDCAGVQVTGAGAEMTVSLPVTVWQGLSGSLGAYTAYAYVRDRESATDGWDGVGSWSLGGTLAAPEAALQDGRLPAAEQAWLDAQDTRDTLTGRTYLPTIAKGE